MLWMICLVQPGWWLWSNVFIVFCSADLGLWFIVCHLVWRLENSWCETWWCFQSSFFFFLFNWSVVDLQWYVNFCCMNFMFRAVLDPQQSCVERTKFLSTLWPHTCPVSLTTNVPHQRDPFETIDELTMMQHYHPKFIVYIRVHSWCWTRTGFGKCVVIGIHHHRIR